MGSEEMTCDTCDEKHFIRTSYICRYCSIGICNDCLPADWIEERCNVCHIYLLEFAAITLQRRYRLTRLSLK
jgi:hypothetical protein